MDSKRVIDKISESFGNYVNTYNVNNAVLIYDGSLNSMMGLYFIDIYRTFETSLKMRVIDVTESNTLPEWIRSSSHKYNQLGMFRNPIEKEALIDCIYLTSHKNRMNNEQVIINTDDLTDRHLGLHDDACYRGDLCIFKHLWKTELMSLGTYVISEARNKVSAFKKEGLNDIYERYAWYADNIYAKLSETMTMDKEGINVNGIDSILQTIIYFTYPSDIEKALNELRHTYGEAETNRVLEQYSKVTEFRHRGRYEIMTDISDGLMDNLKRL